MESGKEESQKQTDMRIVHYVPRGIVEAVCAAKIIDNDFGLWTGDAREITCSACISVIKAAWPERS